MDTRGHNFQQEFTFPSSPRPRTPDEWRLALQSVKLLCLQRQYKQCARRALEILQAAKEPVHTIYKAYLYFYAATSYEFLGRAAHVYSSNKIPLLRSSLDYFLACSAALPAFLPLPNSTSEQRSVSVSTDDFTSSSYFTCAEFFSPVRRSLVSSITELIDSSLLYPDDDPFISDSDIFHDRTLVQPPFKLPPDIQIPKNDCLLPSPLRIRKPSGETTICKSKLTDAKDLEPDTVVRFTQSGRSRPPPLPLKVVPATRLNIKSPSRRTPVLDSQSNPVYSTQCPVLNLPSRTVRKKISKPAKKDPEPVITPTRIAAITRFNKSVAFLRSQVSSSISSIQSQIDNIIGLQRSRRARTMRRSASFWTFSPVKNVQEEDEKVHDREQTVDQFGNIVWKETKEQRIARLRTEGWTTVGLRSRRCEWKGAEYYQAYCNAVLDELYLDD